MPQGSENPSMELPLVAPLRPVPRPTTSGSPPAIPTPLSTVPPLPSTATKRILGFDIENRPLAYWYPGETTAQITAICWKWWDEPDAHVLLLTRNGRWRRDGMVKTLVHQDAFEYFAAVLGDADLVYGHNIRRHDLPIFQAELLRLRLPPLDPVRTQDTLADYPKRKGKSASLESLATELGLGAEKMHMGVVQWERANRLEPAGLNETRARVIRDVLLQERLRGRLLDLGYLRTPRRWNP
jgi:hypothetical protein